MLNVVEIGFEIQINDAGLLFDDGLDHSGYSFMGCPFRSISI
jgi:hypothetical protein